MLRVVYADRRLRWALSCSVASPQDRAPTVPETIVEGMEVVDPLAFQVTAAAWNSFVIRASQLALGAEPEQPGSRGLLQTHRTATRS